MPPSVMISLKPSSTAKSEAAALHELKPPEMPTP